MPSKARMGAEDAMAPVLAVPRDWACDRDGGAEAAAAAVRGNPRGARRQLSFGGERLKGHQLRQQTSRAEAPAAAAEAHCGSAKDITRGQFLL